MGRMIRKEESFDEGEVYYRWENSRISNNKNIISVTTGATGSGKSMMDLRRAEISYRERFNEEFPVDTNCCFSIVELMKRIGQNNLRKGDILILEEAGFNAGSQDWQNKATKIFNYLLQTFRSLNICLYMNLPVLSMLAKQARQLVHIHFETNGIDFDTEKVRVKPLVHQLNQHSGKSYWKFLRIRAKGKVRAVERMSYSLPSSSIRLKYENKKSKFLSDMTADFIKDLEEKERVKVMKMTRADLTDVQREVLTLLHEGKKRKEIAQIRNCTTQSIDYAVNQLKSKGYSILPKENPQNQMEKRTKNKINEFSE